MTDLARTPAKVRFGYAAAGLLTGVLWLAHDGSPLEHAARLLVLMAIVMGVRQTVHWIAERRSRQLPRHPIGRFLVAKVAVVALALAAALALEGWLSYVDLWVALGMGALVALAGPALHPWLMKTRPVSADEANERLLTA